MKKLLYVTIVLALFIARPIVSNAESKEYYDYNIPFDIVNTVTD